MANRATSAANAALAAAPVGDEVEAEGWDTDPEPGDEGEGEDGVGEAGEGGKCLLLICGVKPKASVMSRIW